MQTRDTVGVSGRHAAAGFTLLELIFASAISAFVVLGITALFLLHLKDFRRQKMIRELQQNMRFAADAVARDVRMAGYGIAVRPSDLSQWIIWVTNFTTNPKIVQGATATAPDRLIVAAAAPAATLAAAAAAGSTTLQLQSGQGANFDTARRRVLFVGRSETVRVTGVAGDTLTISASPTTAGPGLRCAHPAGAPVERVDTATYFCSRGTPFGAAEPFLARDDGSGPFTNDWQAMIACGIEDFQLVVRPYGIGLQLTGRCLEADPQYTDPVTRDHYHRITLNTEITPRNAAALLLRSL
jgi:type II secretory pathway pseudopilin PulG